MSYLAVRNVAVSRKDCRAVVEIGEWPGREAFMAGAKPAATTAATLLVPEWTPDAARTFLCDLQALRGASLDALAGAYYYDNGLCVAGDPPDAHHVFDWPSKQWKYPRTPEQVLDEQWATVKRRRNALLSGCDWTQGRDIAESVSAQWAPYRQALRDITLQPDPFNLTWPEPPVG